MEQIIIGGRVVGNGGPALIIAEAGSNHDRSLSQAKSLIDIAVNARADAVKFQTFSAKTIAACTDKGVARVDFAGARTLFELYQKVEMPRQWLPELVEYCLQKEIVFLSTPFDEAAVDELDSLGMQAFKIASFELVHLPFLRYVAKKGKPMILSTGLATLGEIEEALEVIYREGNKQVILLHCAINYPAQFSSVNLAAMTTLQQAFQVPVGYSDHTLGLTVPIAAVARGASVVEKHFTTDKKLPGPDHSFALGPDELRQMVQSVRDTEAALGIPMKQPAADELEHVKRGRRSIFSTVGIPAGTRITHEMLAVLRPGTGLKPRYLNLVVGRQAARDIGANEPITWDDI